MGCYLSFSDEEVFKGMAPLEEMSASPAEKAELHSMATMPASAPKVQATTKAAGEPAVERKSPKFPSWEKVLYPSWPVVAMGQIPHLSGSPGQRFHKWEMMTTPPEPLPCTRIRSHPAGDTDSWFSGSDGMFKKKSIAGGGPWSIPRPIGSGSDVSSWGGNHVYKLHCQAPGNWGHLLEYGNHLSWESGPQWPWTGDSSPGAHNRRCDGPHLWSSQIPTFGW